MRNKTISLAFVATVTIGILAGCGSKQADAKTELDKAAEALAQSETPAPAPAPAAQPAYVPTPMPNAANAPEASVQNPAQSMKQAITAYKSGQMEDAVTRLHKLRAAPTLTPEQRMAVQDSVAAVMSEIYSLAAKGDPRAIAAVKQYERMQAGKR
jgi:hypothetical protein